MNFKFARVLLAVLLFLGMIGTVSAGTIDSVSESVDLNQEILNITAEVSDSGSGVQEVRFSTNRSGQFRNQTNVVTEGDTNISGHPGDNHMHVWSNGGDVSLNIDGAGIPTDAEITKIEMDVKPGGAPYTDGNPNVNDVSYGYVQKNGSYKEEYPGGERFAYSGKTPGNLTNDNDDNTYVPLQKESNGIYYGVEANFSTSISPLKLAGWRSEYKLNSPDFSDALYYGTSGSEKNYYNDITDFPSDRTATDSGWYDTYGSPLYGSEDWYEIKSENPNGKYGNFFDRGHLLDDDSNKFHAEVYNDGATSGDSVDPADIDIQDWHMVYVDKYNFPSDTEIDFGDDGTVDYSRSGTWDSVPSGLTEEISIDPDSVNNNWGDVCDSSAGDGKCDIDVSFSSSSKGGWQIKNMEVHYSVPDEGGNWFNDVSSGTSNFVEDLRDFRGNLGYKAYVRDNDGNWNSSKVKSLSYESSPTINSVTDNVSGKLVPGEKLSINASARDLNGIDRIKLATNQTGSFKNYSANTGSGGYSSKSFATGAGETHTFNLPYDSKERPARFNQGSLDITGDAVIDREKDVTKTCQGFCGTQDTPMPTEFVELEGKAISSGEVSYKAYHCPADPNNAQIEAAYYIQDDQNPSNQNPITGNSIRGVVANISDSYVPRGTYSQNITISSNRQLNRFGGAFSSGYNQYLNYTDKQGASRQITLDQGAGQSYDVSCTTAYGPEGNDNSYGTYESTSNNGGSYTRFEEGTPAGMDVDNVVYVAKMGWNPDTFQSVENRLDCYDYSSDSFTNFYSNQEFDQGTPNIKTVYPDLPSACVKPGKPVEIVANKGGGFGSVRFYEGRLDVDIDIAQRGQQSQTTYDYNWSRFMKNPEISLTSDSGSDSYRFAEGDVQSSQLPFNNQDIVKKLTNYERLEKSMNSDCNEATSSDFFGCSTNLSFISDTDTQVDTSNFNYDYVTASKFASPNFAVNNNKGREYLNSSFKYSNSSVEGTLGYKVWARNIDGEWQSSSTFTQENYFYPDIANGSASKSLVGTGEDVSLNVDVVDNDNDIKYSLFDVKGVNGISDFSGFMSYIGGDTYEFNYTTPDDKTALKSFSVETGVVSTSTSGSKTVNFRNNYFNPVVISLGQEGASKSADHEASRPVIDNVTDTSFDIQTVSDDGSLLKERTAYLVVEEGHFNFQGTEIEAGTYKVNSSSSQTIDYRDDFPTTTVMADSLQTGCDGEPVSSRYSEGNMRSSNVTGVYWEDFPENSNSFSCSQEQTAGYLAVERDVDTTLFETGMKQDCNADPDNNNWCKVSFSKNFKQVPRVFGNPVESDGGDSVVLGRRNLTTKSIDLRPTEDRVSDSEQGHATNDLPWLAFKQGTTFSKSYVTEYNHSYEAEDFQDLTNSTKGGTFNVKDSTDPVADTLSNNVSESFVAKGDAIEISAEVEDGQSGVEEAWLATNETGSWKNYTTQFTSIDEKTGSNSDIEALGINDEKLYVFESDTDLVSYWADNLTVIQSLTLSDSDTGESVNVTDPDSARYYNGKWYLGDGSDNEVCTFTKGFEDEDNCFDLSIKPSGMERFQGNWLIADDSSGKLKEYTDSFSLVDTYDISAKTTSITGISVEDRRILISDSNKNLYEYGHDFTLRESYSLPKATDINAFEKYGSNYITLSIVDDKLYKMADQYYDSPQKLGGIINKDQTVDFRWRNPSTEDRFYYRVWVKDEQGNTNYDSTSVGSQEIDTTPPVYRNQTGPELVDVDDGGETDSLWIEWKDDNKVDSALLATNETGTFQNKTEVYGSPEDLGQVGNTWVNASYEWDNSTLGQVTVGWKVYGNDTSQNFNESSVQTFQTTNFPNIKNINTYGSNGNPKTRFNVGENATIKVNVTDADGRTDIDKVLLNLTNNFQNETVNTELSSTKDITVDGEPGKQFVYNTSPITNVNKAGVWDIDIYANDTVGGSDTASETFIAQLLEISEATPIQNNGDIFNPIPYQREYRLTNPSNVNFVNTEVERAEVVNDVIKGSSSLTNPSDTSISHTINKTDDTLSFTVSSISAQTQNNYLLEYNIFAPQVSETEFDTSNRAQKTIYQYNITPSGESRPSNLEAFEPVDDPDRVTQVKLFLNGSDITTAPSYDFNFIDTDGDGKDDTADWQVPTIQGRHDYELQVFQGDPVQISEEDVILNSPVRQSKQINWRKGLQFYNNNSFDIDFSYKVRLPLRATDITKDGNVLDKQFDSEGAYIPISFTLGAKENSTKFVEYFTPSISTDIEKESNEYYWANKTDTTNISVVFNNPIDNEVRDVTESVEILEGTDVKVYNDGEIIKETGFVEGRYNINISEVSDNSKEEATVVYTPPVADVSYQGTSNSSNGNKLSVWSIQSESPVTRQNVRLEVDRFECVQAKRAFTLESNNTVEVKCGSEQEGADDNGNPVAEIDNLGPNDELQIAFEHRPYKPVIDDVNQLARTAGSQILVAGLALFVLLIVVAGMSLTGSDKPEILSSFSNNSRQVNGNRRREEDKGFQVPFISKYL